MNYYVAPGILDTRTRSMTIEDIETVICEYYEISIEELREQGRYHRMVIARAMIYYIAQKYLHITKKDLARRFKKHHSTVIHGLKLLKDLCDTEENIRDQVMDLEKKIKENKFK